MQNYKSIYTQKDVRTNKSEKNSVSQRLFYYRWTIFLVFLILASVVSNLGITAIAQTKLASVPMVNIPSFNPQLLMENVEYRMKYLTPRVNGVKFFLYKVKRGDNLWKLAKVHRYSVHTIIGCNPQFTTYDVREGQVILIPSIGGTLHPIQKNDSWDKIAQRYDIEVAELQKVNTGIKRLREGGFIFVPGKKPAVDLMNEEMQSRYAMRDLFISPLGGRYTSGFGKRRHPVTGEISVHGGLDIAAAIGSRVGAAAAGTVILASYDVGHYGVAVFIDHHNGYITHYGHLSKINVNVGQKVKAGDIIARSGATGRVTGPHLHFTIKKNGVAVDPRRYLW